MDIQYVLIYYYIRTRPTTTPAPTTIPSKFNQSTSKKYMVILMYSVNCGNSSMVKFSCIHQSPHSASRCAILWFRISTEHCHTLSDLCLPVAITIRRGPLRRGDGARPLPAPAILSHAWLCVHPPRCVGSRRMDRARKFAGRSAFDSTAGRSSLWMPSAHSVGGWGAAAAGRERDQAHQASRRAARWPSARWGAAAQLRGLP